MNALTLHIQAIKRHIKESEMEGKLDKDDPYYPAYQALCDLEEKLADEDAMSSSDRLLNKKQFINAITATYFESRTGMVKSSEVREHLSRAYEAGSLQGVGQERSREINIAVIVEGGLAREILADRHNINAHVFDVDDQSTPTVLHKCEAAEYRSNFDVDDIFEALEAKYS